MNRVTSQNPCPICEKPDWCGTSEDGNLAVCMRESEGSIKKTDNGGYLHRLKDTGGGNGNGGNGKHHSEKSKPKKIWKTKDEIISFWEREEGGRYDPNEDEIYPTFQVLRFNLPDDKYYRPIHQKDGGWVNGDPPGLLPIMNPSDLQTSSLVYVVEGGKCVRAAKSIGLNATTSAHGASSAAKSDWTPLAGKEVFIIPDSDKKGETYADDVATILNKLTPPAIVKIVPLPGLTGKEDIFEYIEKRDSMDPETIRDEIERLAADTPLWIPPAVPVSGPVLTCLADVEPREVLWLWPGRIPLGRITLLVGRPGEGKSFLSVDMASRITTGTPWPDGAICPRGSVILITAEDDPGDTIRPRLDSHYANCKKVHLLTAVRQFDDKNNAREVMFTLSDVDALEAALQTHSDCKLLVVDPIGSFLGGNTDAHRDNEVRSILSPIGQLAEKYGPAVLVVAHRRKSSGTFADDLALGSRAFTGIARCVWHLSRDKDNKSRRLLLPGKNNLAAEGDGLAFAIQGDPPRIIWERDPVTMNADDGLAIENGTGESERLTPAAEWLRGQLKDHQERTVQSLKDEAKAAGLSWRQVERASSRLMVRVFRSTFGGGCVWQLPRPGLPYSPPNGEYVKSGENGKYGENV